MNIGEASKATGISVKMLRYYEEIGLVRPALRAHSGYRVYSDKNIAMLRFVRRARDLGFQVKQIAALLDLWLDGSRASADVKSLALDHVRELEKRRRELDEMIATLEHLAHHCHGDERPDCPILTSLGAEEGTPPNAARKKPSRRSFAVAG
jgi:Cu(I)-responsive transcriptional regulator